MNSLVDTKKW